MLNYHKQVSSHNGVKPAILSSSPLSMQLLGMNIRLGLNGSKTAIQIQFTWHEQMKIMQLARNVREDSLSRTAMSRCRRRELFDVDGNAKINKESN